ncbi:MAG: UDP-3-O-acyl-N-acetylglucosamine deacetylase [Candidatus Omnitrophota bacterium]
MLSQKTIENEIFFSGRGLQTGSIVKAVCKPQGAGSGITFKRVDIKGAPCLCLGDALFPETRSPQRRTTIGAEDVGVQTVEHFLAALWALQIDNILVEMDGGELPALDGSAEGFLKRLKETPLKEFSEAQQVIRVLEPERVEENGDSLSVFPHEGLNISYLIDYKSKAIGRETFKIELTSDSFEKEIAPARTFCLKREVETLLRLGLGQGADLKNTLVIDDDGPIGTNLRFPNEPVRHKVLDLVGDLYVLGRPFLGRFSAEKSGHKLNARMVKVLYEKYVKKIK